MRRKRIVGGTAAVAGALSLLAVGMPATAHAAAPAAGPRWGDCPAGTEAPRGTYCSTLKVPLDYKKPDGRQIKLTLSIAGAGNAPRTLVVNPGGPGESGIGVAKMVWSALPEKVTRKYNVVSFDPRGVGASTPVSCGDTGKLTKHPALPYTPKNASQEKKRLTVARKVAEQCDQHSRDLLPHMTTENAARDMDRIRAALGKSKLDYLGYSYGTRLGATYATLFPKRTGRMVLDSVMDPTASSYTSQFQQNTALQHRAEQFFSWTAKHDRTYRLGASRKKVAAAWEATRKKLTARPAGGRAGSAELDDLLASAMYTDLMWSELARAVSDYRRGDTGALLSATDQLAGSGASPAMLAYSCVDDPWPRELEDLARGHARLGPQGAAVRLAQHLVQRPVRVLEGQAHHPGEDRLRGRAAAAAAPGQGRRGDAAGRGAPDAHGPEGLAPGRRGRRQPRPVPVRRQLLRRQARRPLSAHRPAADARHHVPGGACPDALTSRSTRPRPEAARGGRLRSGATALSSCRSPAAKARRAAASARAARPPAPDRRTSGRSARSRRAAGTGPRTGRRVLPPPTA
ncbi:alpha/beta fold hydrolase [Streptomyces sp. PmtG]